MTFNTTNLANARVLVQGTDIHGGTGKVILDGSQWAEIKARKEHDAALENYDQEVERFFAPLMAAEAKLEATHYMQVDPASVVVLDPGTEGVEARQGTIAQLNSDSIVLRLIEEGKTDRLIWVGDSLEVTAFEAPTSGSVGSTGLGFPEDPDAAAVPAPPAPPASDTDGNVGQQYHGE